MLLRKVKSVLKTDNIDLLNTVEMYYNEKKLELGIEEKNIYKGLNDISPIIDSDLLFDIEKFFQKSLNSSKALLL